MSTATRFLRRDPAEVRPWAETCGQIRCLVEEKDGAAAEVHHVEIEGAKLHYHARTDEFYYVIDGQGTMILDDEEIELHIEKKSFSSGVILSAMVMTFAEELMERSLLKRLPMRS